MASFDRQTAITTISVIAATILAALQIKEFIAKPTADVEATYISYEYVLPPGTSEVKRMLEKRIRASEVIAEDSDLKLDRRQQFFIDSMFDKYQEILSKPLNNVPRKLLVFTIQNNGDKATSEINLVTKQQGVVYISGRIDYKEVDGTTGINVGFLPPRDSVKVYFWSDSFSFYDNFYVSHKDGTEDVTELVPLGGVYKFAYEFRWFIVFVCVFIIFLFTVGLLEPLVKAKANSKTEGSKSEVETSTESNRTPAKRRRRKRKPKMLPPPDSGST